jgi:hypothetical protein
MVTLSQPVYPSLARQAAIIGEVALVLRIRKDGTVESAVAESGPPLLRQAALNSAQQSRYDCQNCSETLNSYRLVYAFLLIDEENCCNSVDDPRITQSQNRITITNRHFCFCDPAATLGKVRSLKCLYLWRCSSR